MSVARARAGLRHCGAGWRSGSGTNDDARHTLPRDAQSFEATRTLDVPGPLGGKATLKISLRHAGPGR